LKRGDVVAVRQLVLKDPKLLHESARGLPDSKWGHAFGWDHIDAHLRRVRGARNCTVMIEHGADVTARAEIG